MRVNNLQSRSWLNGLAIATVFSPFGVTAGAAPNTFEVVGTTGVSAQQFFVGGINKVRRSSHTILHILGMRTPH
jgi:hypothetical protein